MASPFQPLSAKNFLAVKSTTKPVPQGGGASGGGTGSSKVGRGMGSKGVSRRVVSPRGVVGSSSSTSRNAMLPSSSDHSNSTASFMGTEELLAGLPQLPYGQSSGSQKGGAIDSIVGGGGGNSSSSSGLDHNRNHESSISNIIRERDLAVIEDRKLKVRFEHLHHSCPVIDEGSRNPQSGSGQFKAHGGGENPSTISKSSGHSATGLSPSSPRSTVDIKGDLKFDLAQMTRRGISLQNLPVTSGLQQTLLLRKEQTKDADSDFAIESMHGDKLATIEKAALWEGTQEDTWERVIRDMDSNVYAVILHSVVEGNLHRFKICGNDAMFPDQRKSRDSGLFTYADVKNSSGIGVKFTMKLRGDSLTKYFTESFGPSIFQRGRRGQNKSTRGYIIKETDGADGKKGADGKEVARLTFLGAGKAISIGPDQDFRLMIAFAAIIDEMVEKRLR